MQSIEKCLLVKGFLIATSFKFIIIIVPLKYYIKLLHSNTAISSNKATFDSRKLINRCIARVEKISPWNLSCLNKVITAHFLYRDMGIVSSIILSLFEKSPGIRGAHASLIIEDSYYYLPISKSVKSIPVIVR